MIKAVIFDVGGVLHRFNKHFFRINTKKTLGISDEQFDASFKPIHVLLSTGKIDESEFWKQMASATKTTSKIPKESVFEPESRINFVRDEEMFKIVDTLKKTGLKLAILSNSIESHAKINREKKIYEPFDLVILSHEVGLRKPDQKIYEYVFEKLNLKPEETVFIDDLEENIDAAKKMGMNGIIFTDPDQLKLTFKNFGIDLEQK